MREWPPSIMQHVWVPRYKAETMGVGWIETNKRGDKNIISQTNGELRGLHKAAYHWNEDILQIIWELAEKKLITGDKKYY
jgi:hypothetical protein